MKIEKNVLIMSSFPNKITRLFDETFNTFKSYEQENVEKFIESLSDKIEAIAVMGGTTVSSELIKKLPKLKIIANYGVGYDAVDVKQATLSNVKVTNTPDVLNDEVADTAIALTLCVYKNIALANQFLLEKKWLKSEYPLSKKFSGTKFGILGMGRIGKTIAKRIESGRYVMISSLSESPITAKKIFESLAKIEGHISPRTAGNICSTKIEKLSPTNTVSDAGKIMHRKKIDQNLVKKNGLKIIKNALHVGSSSHIIDLAIFLFGPLDLNKKWIYKKKHTMF